MLANSRWHLIQRLKGKILAHPVCKNVNNTGTEKGSIIK
jgi:hypothetical protein